MKLRSRWFLKQTMGKERESLAEALSKVRGSLPEAPGTSQWELAGPTNVGGRMTCLVCHPDKPDTIWAGSAAGGVWKSEKAGNGWKMVWKDQEATLNIGALALDPKDPDHLYCGTGEANLLPDSYPGVGLYHSQDGGETWDLLAPAGPGGPPTRIGVIAVDPFDSTRILLGAVGSRPSEPGKSLGGLYTSTAPFTSWTRNTAVFSGQEDYQCHSVVFHPDRQGMVFATFTEGGSRNGIWKSVDGGDRWVQLHKGLPSAETIQRTSLTIAPSEPDVIYALAADRGGYVLGVFRSLDAGETWQDVSANHFGTEEWMSYANVIAVHPKEMATVICGGVNLHLTRDGGRSWNQVTDFTANRGDSWYAHADHHALVLPAAEPGRIYDANDGGLDVSEDGGRTWVNRSSGLAVTMYYDMDVFPSDGRRFGGGTQDNGTQLTLTGGSADHFTILRGDGGWMVFDPQDPHHFYASSQHMRIYRWRQGVRTEVTFVEESEGDPIWMAFMAMNPRDPRNVFVGSQRVWRTLDDGDRWDPVSPVFDRTDISALEVAPADPRRVYAGTAGGGFFQSLDGGDTWSGNLAGALLPDRMITRIETSPNDADRLFVTVGGFGNHHVFRSLDGGWSWEDADGGGLPDAPFNAVVLPPGSPDTVYVCGDAGVFVSRDGGRTWMVITRKLPRARVTDLVFDESEDTLYAATYGRSLWRLRHPGR
jgi:photosystem II stability/assembly factor-like uncharacterized protein